MAGSASEPDTPSLPNRYLETETRTKPVTMAARPCVSVCDGDGKTKERWQDGAQEYRIFHTGRRAPIWDGEKEEEKKSETTPKLKLQVVEVSKVKQAIQDPSFRKLLNAGRVHGLLLYALKVCRA